MKKRLFVLTCAAILLLMAATAEAQVLPNNVTNTYAAKFICGVQQEQSVNFPADAQGGRYSTKINVHNNSGSTISFRKKIIALRGGESDTQPQAKVFEALKPDHAMEVVCRDIYKLLQVNITGQLPPPYIEGFVIFEVYYTQGTPAPPRDPLDVEGIYTYRGDIPNPTGQTVNLGASIDVVVFPAKFNAYVMQP